MQKLEKKIYFASDFHLGVPARLSSKEREIQIIRWLESIRGDAEEIFLVGDLFDFWFEYKTVVPKGCVRLLGKLAELSDAGIKLHFFTGNHDMWIFDYFEKELNIPTYRNPIERTIAGKRFLIGHGDGLGPGDYGYKFIKRVFANPFCQWLFERLHPNFGIGLANFWSNKSRALNPNEAKFYGAENEWLISYCEEVLKEKTIDYFIFGHRHLPIVYDLNDRQSVYVNLGEWLNFNSFASFDGIDLELKFFENEAGKIFGNRFQENTNSMDSNIGGA